MSTASASSTPLTDTNGTAITTAYGQPFSSLQSRTAEFLKLNFSMTELNDIHNHLWMAGSYDNINTLHHQRVLLRNIIPSELPRLHLIWFDRTIYIKPLPDCLLNSSYFSDQSTDSSGLVVGFLRSYCKLIQYPVDLAIAKKTNLISKDITWDQWLTFRETILTQTKNSHFNKRYRYGELRLNRLDIIYRLTGRGLTYFTVHREYKTYFAQYFSLFATVFAFVAVTLAAMQVLVGIRDIPETLAETSYRFSVAVLVGVCLFFGYVFLVFLFMFLYNLALTRVAHRVDKASMSSASWHSTLRNTSQSSMHGVCFQRES